MAPDPPEGSDLRPARSQGPENGQPLLEQLPPRDALRPGWSRRGGGSVLRGLQEGEPLETQLSRRLRFPFWRFLDLSRRWREKVLTRLHPNDHLAGSHDYGGVPGS